MIKSKEIRWFSSTEEKSINKWFSRNGYTFENAGSRTDFYLPLKGKEDIGIKLREGKIEVKQRIDRPEKGKIAENAQGYFENYIKWSFSTAEDDQLSKEIIDEKKYEWFEVKKERMGFKLIETEEGKSSMVNLNEYIPYGCQIEYTRLRIKEKIWYSFGLEWFGPEIIRVDPGFIKEILDNNQLRPEESMGYAEMLNKDLFTG